MPAPRRTAVAAAGALPLALTVLTAAPAAAHGTMGDPVSRVSQCYAEGPESPGSAACRAAVAAGGTQALYDWNGVRIGDAAGRHRELIPDGKLCSANSEEFKGLDLARADWPATAVSSGSYTFKYRVTAQHKGTFTVYLTKDGYDPSQPLAWDDLELTAPVATVTDPAAADGFYTFSGTLPERTGQHLLYAVWQRSDSPEAFYSCSDVTFGGDGADGTATGESGEDDTPAAAPAPAPAASAPSDEQIAAGTGRSTVEHHGHGDQDATTTTDPTAPGYEATGATEAAAAGEGGAPSAAGGSADLAETGGDGSTASFAVGGAAALALGAATLFASVRRRAGR
ncbi:lytic polysaccharide monooxygenase [Streptomyces griseoviridis]|uniref:Chitin-binding protein n=2 Tax=Streptomyces griseoviridis TaxID=45398 RepID=A0A918GFT0_STRGD|nr:MULTISPECIES: lytic polysaccharide monooxygenase [Streptomyces]MDP9680936.1 chitin-binding protein [Streptomyces griseoviridis]GGS33970.1 chitin-binding protein [Streptomyces niveoruber]GGT16986.1 chitin-binding protein [Streptomyces griseoviridis]